MKSTQRQPSLKIMDDSGCYKRLLRLLRENHFLDPNYSNLEMHLDGLKNTFRDFKSATGNSPYFGMEMAQVDQSFKDILPTDLSEHPYDVLKQLPYWCKNAIRGNHSLTMKNIIPTPSFPGLVAHIITSTLMANLVASEDSGELGKLERKCAKAMAKLAGYNPSNAHGIFTFGGTATNLYGLKIALLKAIPDSSQSGIREPIYFLHSRPSHYCHFTAASWLGIGADYLINIPSNASQEMIVDDLKKATIDILESGKKIGGFILSGGTTSGLGIDPIGDIIKFRNQIATKYNLPYKPHVHVDSVIGWAFLTFKDYDFALNPLELPTISLEPLAKIVAKLIQIEEADSFGIDFHKTGFTAYNASMFITKIAKDMNCLARDPSSMPPLFHESESLNPGTFTLETSRSSATVANVWATLNTLGEQGMQVLLAHAIEMSLTLRENINESESRLFVINEECMSPDVFIGVYNNSRISKQEYLSMLVLGEISSKEHNEILSNFYSFAQREIKCEDLQIAFSKSSAAIYNVLGEPIQGIRIYTLNPYIDNHALNLVTKFLTTTVNKFFEHA